MDIVRCVVQRAAGRLQVVASGHTADELPEQIEQLERMSETGVDVVVLVAIAWRRRMRATRFSPGTHREYSTLCLMLRLAWTNAISLP